MKKTRLFHNGRGMALFIALVALMAIPSLSAAGNLPWTTVGSAGTVDESDLSTVSLSAGTVSLKTSLESETAYVRYNVVAENGLFNDCLKMAVRFQDNGDSAQVIVRLKQYNMTTGHTTTLLTLDSDTFGASGIYQLQAVGSCALDRLNFQENAYYIEAQLRKTAAAGRAGLAIIKLYSIKS